MCMCEKPTKNGEQGYRWNSPDGPTSIYPVNPPALTDHETAVFDEPGRCGGQDSHSYHYLVTSNGDLLVRHGGGDARVHLSNYRAFVAALRLLDSDARYWILNAMYHAQSKAATDARFSEHSKWVHAIAQKRIKTSKRNGTVHVSIVPEAEQPAVQS